MDLRAQVIGYLRVTDPTHRLTYTKYVTDAIERGIKPISAQDWDILVSMVGDRQMTDTAVERNFIINMKIAIDNKP